MNGISLLQPDSGNPLQALMQKHTHAAQCKPSSDSKQPDPTANHSGPQSYSLSESYGISRSFELEIKTREGDTVKIKVDAEHLQSLLAKKQSDANGSSTTAEYAEKNSLKFSYSVDGNLNDDELKALDRFFSDANKLADSFYSGNVENAFKQASKLSFNSDEIASFSINMSQNEAYSKTEAYQQVQDQPSDASTPAQKPANNPNELFRKLGKFLNDAAEFVRKHADEVKNKKHMQEILKQLPVDDSIKNKWQEFLAGAINNSN